MNGHKWTHSRTHTCKTTKVFVTVSLFNGKRLLSRATWGVAPPPSLPQMLSSARSVSSPQPRCSLFSLSSLSFSENPKKSHWTAQHSAGTNKLKTMWHVWPFVSSLNYKKSEIYVVIQTLWHTCLLFTWLSSTAVCVKRPSFLMSHQEKQVQ